MTRRRAVEGIHDMTTTMRHLTIAAALLGSLWAGTALANAPVGEASRHRRTESTSRLAHIADDDASP